MVDDRHRESQPWPGPFELVLVKPKIRDSPTSLVFPQRSIILRAAQSRMSGSHDLKKYRRRLQDKSRAERYAHRFETGARQGIDRREQNAVKKILADLKDCASVLDVPSGAGRFLSTLSDGGRTVLEMDVAFEILEFAQKKAAAGPSPALVLQGDASRLPLTDNAVDCVFSNRLLHHIHLPAERRTLLREFHRVCRRWAVVSFFNYKGMARLRRLLKRLKGRKPPYENQPTFDQFKTEAEQVGFTVKALVPIGPPWLSQKYVVLEKR
jgi:ubiquinone/menaquinone biosynthesis C-methylase UbiE